MSEIRRDAARPIEPSGLRSSVVGRLLRPRSVAIVGFSAREGSSGKNVLTNLLKNGFPGDIHLVGRADGNFEGRPVLAGVEALPEGIDLAVLALPAAAVQDAVEACIGKKVGAAVVFASGFAETGDDAREAQEALTCLADASGFGIVGPNCLGFTNFIDRVDVGFLLTPPTEAPRDANARSVAIVAQSGGLMGLLSQALAARRIPISYRISTGNEAGLGLSDYVAYLADDAHVATIAIYAEHIRRPQEFLVAARKARTAGKNIVLMHTGRGVKAQRAAASHTGALAGNYSIMAAQTACAGVIVTESIEEMIDCAELAVRFPEPPTLGPAVITTSGAFCAIAHDACEELGFDLPPLSPSSIAALRPRVPEFTPPNNPLDLGTAPAWEPELISDAMLMLMDDPAIGSVTIAAPLGQGHWVKPLVEALPRTTKPLQLALFNDDAAIPEDVEELVRSAGLTLSRSPERALRAMARYTEYGRRLQYDFASVDDVPPDGLPPFGPGVQPEWLGKQALRALSIRVPEGALAGTAQEAIGIANRIGYPVVLKVQAAELAHKTEVGGVMVNIASDEALRSAFLELETRVRKARPDVTLDGILVETMAGKGLELVAGATRDPLWGPVVMIGMGGVLVEALEDVRIIPAGLGRTAIVAELYKLKLAKLLGEFRGSAAPDVEAVAEVVEKLGLLMLRRHDIGEIDVNPLVALPKGEGVIALDALFVTNREGAGQ